jgi:hypothetical protein
MFWGDNRFVVSKAMNIIRSRIVKIYKQMEPISSHSVENDLADDLDRSLLVSSLPAIEEESITEIKQTTINGTDKESDWHENFHFNKYFKNKKDFSLLVSS